MSTSLKHYFPMLWEKEELLGNIRSSKNLSATFYKWTPDQQEVFIDFCTGVRGIKLLYDGFFKEIMSAEYTPERLNEFLSLLLEKKVRIHTILPNDSTRIADESSLLVTDLVVELEDGSLANVEIQKIGYNFPGQRSACYSSDMLLRQYRRIRSLKKKKFNYRDVKDVYTIVLFENSTSEFHKFHNNYIHRFCQHSDTGLELDLLQKYVFIALDIFHENHHNKTITNKLDAWLLFLSSDKPEDILQLILAYPEFQAMYEQAYALCRNLEDVMGFFSEELRILDRNTVQYMMDEMQEKINELSETLEQKIQAVNQQNETLEKQSLALEQQSLALEEKDAIIEEMKRKIAELEGK